MQSNGFPAFSATDTAAEVTAAGCDWAQTNFNIYAGDSSFIDIWQFKHIMG